MIAQKESKLIVVADKLRDFSSDSNISAGAVLVGALGIFLGGAVMIGEVTGLTDLSHYPTSNLFDIFGTKISYFSPIFIGGGVGVLMLQQGLPRLAASGLEAIASRPQSPRRRK